MVIFDLDGCLSDDRARKNLINTSWDAYHNNLDSDNVINYDAYKMHYDQGDLIAIITGRPWSYVKTTRRWLEQHKIHCDFLVMRHVEDKTPSPILKVKVVKKLTHILKRNVKMAYDDRQDIIDAYAKAGIHAMVLDINSNQINKR